VSNVYKISISTVAQWVSCTTAWLFRYFQAGTGLTGIVKLIRDFSFFLLSFWNAKYKQLILCKLIKVSSHINLLHTFSDLHRGPEVDVVSSEIHRFSQKHEERLHHHENIEAIQLLDNMGIARRLQRKKTFWAILSDSVKAVTVLVQVLVWKQSQC